MKTLSLSLAALALLTGAAFGTKALLKPDVSHQQQANADSFARHFPKGTWVHLVSSAGDIFIGRVELMDEQFLLLSTVYHIMPRPDGAGNPVVIRRSEEVRHRPTNLAIGLRQVLLVEDVGSQSELGQYLRSQGVMD